MRSFLRKKILRDKRAQLLSLLLVLPFVVGFDIPDSAGTYARVSGGRGAYHLTGCHRDFDSEFWEGQVNMRHTFHTASGDSGSLLKRMAPELTTLGYHADFVTQDLTVVKADTNATDSRVGDTENPRGFAAGAYLGLDWKWVGVDLGLAALLLNLGVDDAEKNKVSPMLGLRLGLMDGVYVTGEVCGSTPYLTGGGQVDVGLGGKYRNTRAWLGVGSYGFNGFQSLAVIRLQQGFGPWDLFLTAQGSGKDVPPANLGIDHESGFSLGLSYRLSSLD